MKKILSIAVILLFALCSFAQAAGVSKIYKFAQTDTGSNLLTDTVYGASNYTDRTIGNQPGIAKSKLVNKALRQSTTIASGLAYFLAANLDGIEITDNDTAAKISGHINDALDVLVTAKTAAVADHTAQLADDIGDCKSTIRLTAPAKWLLCDGKTIGNAASNGTARANADTATLFALLWVLPNENIPIYTSAGVLSSRGGSAAADFAANKAIALPNMKGKVPVGYDASQTEFDGMGETGGEKTHVLNGWEIAKHTHPASSSTTGAHTHTAEDWYYPVGMTGNFFSGASVAITGTNRIVAVRTTSSNGAHSHTMTVSNQTIGDGAHNNLQPYITLNYIIKYQ